MSGGEEFPCIRCCKEVRPRQHAVLCDVCESWQHRTCDTGITITAYREAVKMEIPIQFVCKPCLQRIPSPAAEGGVVEEFQTEMEGPPVLEMSAPVPAEETFQGDTEPPVLEASFPVAAEETFQGDCEPPSLEASFPVAAEETGVQVEWTIPADVEQTILADADSTLMDVTDIDLEATPAAESTQHEISFMELSFDLSHRNVEDPDPIQEQPIDDASAINDTILEEQEETYTLMEKGSQKRTSILISSFGYSYGVKRSNKNSVLWRCNVRNSAVYCPATVRQHGNDFTRSLNQHIHPAVPDRKLKAEVYSKVKSGAELAVFRPAMEVVEDVILDHADDDFVSFPKRGLLKRVANRTRANQRPKEPKDLKFEVNKDFLRCEDFLIGDVSVGESRHFLFATEDQLELLRRAKKWYMDGTFKVLGDPFGRPGQLMSIHAFIEKDGKTQQCPLVFCLMSRKTKDDYLEIFRTLRSTLGTAAVEGFVLDFKIAAWLAIKEEFPGVDIRGCVFHWAQALWRKVQESHLVETYNSKGKVHDYIRQLMALPFLPAAHIRPTFEALERRACTTELKELVRYIRSQWMDGNIFTPESWSVFHQTVRTNNDVEGWHHRLNSKAGHSGLGFYRIVPLLRREAELVRHAVRTGDLVRDVRGSTTRLDAALTKLWDQYMDQELTCTGFLRRCGQLYGVRV